MANDVIKKRVNNFLKHSTECEERYIIYTAKGYSDSVTQYEKGQANAFYLAAFLLALDVSEDYANKVENEMKTLRGR